MLADINLYPNWINLIHLQRHIIRTVVKQIDKKLIFYNL